MTQKFPRRAFLGSTLKTAGWLAAGGFNFVRGLPRVSGAEAGLERRAVRLSPEIEPLVRLIEETPREKLLEEIALRVQRGLPYRNLVAGLFMAGVRNIEPRPVGFKFHAVLVVNSAHLASLASADRERWLPVFWALDYFKDSQARNHREGDWRMTPVDEARLPAAHQAQGAFVTAMDNWDVAGADAAVTALSRTATPRQVFELFCRYGMRDFREIGHKAIYVANSWRMLQVIGWHHAEPVLRSLAYALLDHEGGNPAKRDASPDRPFRENLERIKKIPSTWMTGSVKEEATREILSALRVASTAEACEQAVALMEKGIAPASVWHAVLQAGAELVMRAPGIGSLHSLTCANALHFSFQQTNDDGTRRLLLMQAVAFMTLFRGTPKRDAALRIDDFQPAFEGRVELPEIFEEMSRNRSLASKKALAYLTRTSDAEGFAAMARHLVFAKGRDSHDYKFSSAILEDYHQLPAGVRERYLAASVFQLRGAGDSDNALIGRVRDAFAART